MIVFMSKRANHGFKPPPFTLKSALGSQGSFALTVVFMQVLSFRVFTQ